MDFFKNISSDVDGFPELKYVIDTLTEILDFMMTDDMMKLKEESKESFEQVMADKFKDFSERYFSLFCVILDGEMNSLSNLVMMINTLCMVKTKKISMDEGYAHIREELAGTYIYPQFGGKEQFEKTIKERSKKNKKHQK
jgi:hypothetical protein